MIRKLVKGCSESRAQPHYVTARIVQTNPDDNVSRIHEAVTLASDSDVAVLVVGDNEMTSREPGPNRSSATGARPPVTRDMHL